jgi:hypothetical protein
MRKSSSYILCRYIRKGHPEIPYLPSIESFHHWMNALLAVLQLCGYVVHHERPNLVTALPTTLL